MIVLGDKAPFELAACRDLLQPPERPESAERWLWQTLQRVRPWVDVIVALDAPPWATQVLADRTRNTEGLWSPWAVATADVKHLEVDRALDGDISRVLLEAHQRAQSARPQIL